MMIKNRPAAKIHQTTVQVMEIINSNVDNAQNHSNSNDCSTVTWNVIRISNAISVHSVEKDSMIHSIWNDTLAHIPAFGHTNAIYVKNHLHNAVHSNHIVWKCMVFNISMHTKSVVQRYGFFLCLQQNQYLVHLNSFVCVLICLFSRSKRIDVCMWRMRSHNKPAGNTLFALEK